MSFSINHTWLIGSMMAFVLMGGLWIYTSEHADGFQPGTIQAWVAKGAQMAERHLPTLKPLAAMKLPR